MPQQEDRKLSQEEVKFLLDFNTMGLKLDNIIKAVHDLREEIGNEHDELVKRVAALETKSNYYAGAIAVFALAAPLLLKKLGL